MYLLGTLVVMATTDWSKGGPGYEYWWAELLIDVFLVCCLLMVIPKKIRRWVRVVFAVVAYVLALVDLFCYVKFGSTITPTMLLLVGETNSQETSEFFRSYFSFDLLAGPVGWVLLLAMGHLAIVVIQRLTESKGWLRRLKERIPDVALSVSHVMLPLLLVVALCVSAVLCADNKQAFARLMTHRDIGSVEHELTRTDRVSLYQPLYRLAFSIRANQLASQQLTQIIDHIDEAQVDSCSFRSPEIVLIVGESYNKRHAQLYGYDKETTPRQVAMAKEGSLVPFTNVIAPWNLTSFVFKLMFSLYAVGDEGDWCDYPLFPVLFKKAGYEVDFFTNQFLPQAKEAVYDFSGGFFLNNPTLSQAMFDRRNHKLHYFDEGLLKEIGVRSEENSDSVNPRLTIVHLKGQHVDYRTRCPKSKQHFKRADYDRPKLSKKELQDLAYYDNATRYNDSIVAEIVHRYENRNVIIVYTPDHGEEVYNDDVHLHGRLHNDVIDCRLAHEEFDIPFWIWCSPSYRQQHPDLWQAVRESKDKRFMIDALPHLLLYLAGIHTPFYRERLNILSPTYDEGRPRILKGYANYDELTREQVRMPESSQFSSLPHYPK